MNHDVFEIDVGQLKRMQQSHVAFALFDIRSRADYEDGHIKGALHLRDLEHLTQLIKIKDAAIVVYDQDGVSAFEFAKQASSAGYINIVYLVGGIKNYST